MNTLYLLRHAKAETQGEGGDRERKLAEAGVRTPRPWPPPWPSARSRPSWCCARGSARTRQTLELVLPALKPAPRIVYEDGLYLADAKQLLARLRHVPEETAASCWSGTIPGLQELAVLLSDQPTGPLMAQLAQGFPTAALASFEMPPALAGARRRHARICARFIALK